MLSTMSTHVQQPVDLRKFHKTVFSNFKYYQLYLKLYYVVQKLKIVKCEFLNKLFILILKHPCVYSSGYEP